MFRCLLLHFNPAIIRALERPAKLFKERLEEFAHQSFDDGVEVSMLATVETCFEVAINVYALQEDKTAKTIRMSNFDYKQDDVMHLSLYENHFSFIKKGKFKSYAKKYTCLTCTRIFNGIKKLYPHIKKCLTEVEEMFQGGKYRNKKTVSEHLDRSTFTFLKPTDSIRTLSCTISKLCKYL